jgi:anaerobic magnesium-protoporphyrin IX monomethyl ester cyclase
VFKVQLVNAPGSSLLPSAGSQGCFPHLGLVQLATVLSISNPDVEIEILDGTVLTLKEITSRIDGDVVGISVLTMTYASALTIAREAKLKGSYVVLGNDHASRRWSQILARRPEVDAIFVGDFVEFSFANLVATIRSGGTPAMDLPGLCVRRDGVVHSSPPASYLLSDIPLPNRSLICHNRYVEIFNDRFETLHGYKARNSVSNHFRGCVRRTNRCSFCDIFSLDIHQSPAERAWEDWVAAYDEGFDWIWEVCDDFATFNLSLGGPSVIDRLLECKPNSGTPRLFVYSRAAALNESLGEKYARLGVAKVNIGMESGSDTMLRRFSKGNPRGARDNLRAASVLLNNGIQIHVSLVLGGPGETSETLRETIDFAEMLLHMPHVTSVDPSVLLPLPGAPVWKNFSSPEFALTTAEKYNLKQFSVGNIPDFSCEDLFDTSMLSAIWVKNFTHVTHGQLIDAVEAINRIATERGKVPGAFGIDTAPTDD